MSATRRSAFLDVTISVRGKEGLSRQICVPNDLPG
jgi:hypothetical protein